MNPGLSQLLRAWSLEPSIIGGCLGLMAGYLWLASHPLPVQGEGDDPGEMDVVAAGCFLAGVNVLLLSLISPLDVLSDEYLFSAHMLQHMLLVMIVPPLLLLGLPAPLTRRLLSWRPVAALERVVRNPVLAWSMSMATLWIWHIPALYNAALYSERIHVLEHVSFILTAVVFWWPVLAPVRGPRLSPLACVAYLFLGAVVSGLLGIILTFADPALYPAYTGTADPLGILPVLRDQWGLTPAFDQQMGGLLMWVAGSTIFLVAILRSVVDWYGGNDDLPPAADLPAREGASQPQVSIALEEVTP